MSYADAFVPFLILYMLGNLKKMLSANFFSKLTFSKISFRNTIRVTNILDSDRA